MVYQVLEGGLGFTIDQLAKIVVEGDGLESNDSIVICLCLLHEIMDNFVKFSANYTDLLCRSKVFRKGLAVAK
jgi:hypothetical protein